MTIATLQEFKDYVRELTNDLDGTFTLALESASAEVRHYLGFDPEADSGGPEPDVVIACCLLAAVHGDVGDPQVNAYRRRAAQRLLDPYRLNTGFGAAESQS
ncbi:head-tail connector protein [Luteimonas lutimaris]|uniref:Phage gp6-like head-tail connector protein n=1 Tax=Luteimonas lutimaris TaxID=698645 RepID=A0ABP7MR87_9GAMM